jgi:GNAT superfamily N-acetyltransferase
MHIRMKIRLARKEDIPAITMQNMLLAEESEHLTLDPNTTRRGVCSLLADPSKGWYLVAEQDGTIIGQLMITVEWSDWRNQPIWWVQSVFVQKEWRKKRVFSRLLQEVQKRARTHHVAFLRLYAHHENLPALGVYRKTGWTQEPYVTLRHSI